MKLSSKKELDEAIIALEKKKVAQKQMLKEHYEVTIESLSPGKLIKDAFSSITHSPGAGSTILKTITGIAVGLLTKKLFIGKSSSFVSKMVSNAVKFGVAKAAISNTDKIKAYGAAIYNNLFRRKSKRPEEQV